MKKAPKYICTTITDGEVCIKRINRNTGAYSSRYYLIKENSPTSYRLGMLVNDLPYEFRRNGTCWKYGE